MLKVIYGVLVGLLAGYWIGYYFSNKQDVSSSNEVAKTSIAVEKRIRNLGKIKVRQPITTEFKIVNIGEVPLTIYNIDVDCKCTIPSWEKTPIKPRGSTIVKMTYDAHMPGFFSKKAMIKYNSFDGDYVLLIQGEVL